MRADQFLYVNYVLQYVNGHAAGVGADETLGSNFFQNH